MPSRAAVRQPPKHKPNKTEIKKQKRKRDHEDLQKIDEAIQELVGCRSASKIWYAFLCR
jgi:ATP-dependent RNA helicase DDX10/DBP4